MLAVRYQLKFQYHFQPDPIPTRVWVPYFCLHFLRLSALACTLPPANPISSDCVYAFYYIYLQPLLIQLVRKTVRCFLFHLRFTQLLTPVRVYAASFLAFVALCLQFSSSITLKRHQWSLGSGRAGKGGRICHGCFTLASLSRVPGLAVPRARRFMVPSY